MKHITIAVAAFLAAAVSANAAVDFDRGVDVKSAVEEARASVPQLPEAKIGIPSYSVRDCKKVEFAAGGPLASDPVSLRSMEMYQDCQNFGAPVGQICTPRPEYRYASVRAALTSLPALAAGKKEVFEVCLQGPFLSLTQDKKNSYKYSVKQDMEGFLLTPKTADKGLFGHQEQPADACRIAMDKGHVCVYRCADGSFFSKPNPFPVIPAPNQWVGPIHTPCAPVISRPQLPEFAG